MLVAFPGTETMRNLKLKGIGLAAGEEPNGRLALAEALIGEGVFLTGLSLHERIPVPVRRTFPQ